MTMGKEKLIPVFATIVLLIGISSTIYVQATQNNTDIIEINGQDYTIDDIFKIADTRTITIDEGELSGVALDDLIIKTTNICNSCNQYTFKAKDNYQQTVPWSFMQKGILTQEGRIYFPDTAHSFWVRDIVKIEVN